MRNEIKARLGERPENSLAPYMWGALNPAYRLDEQSDSRYKETFMGKSEEPVDKVYFRRKDGLADYAEALFKSKVVLAKR